MLRMGATVVVPEVVFPDDPLDPELLLDPELGVWTGADPLSTKVSPVAGFVPTTPTFTSVTFGGTLIGIVVVPCPFVVPEPRKFSVPGFVVSSETVTGAPTIGPPGLVTVIVIGTVIFDSKAKFEPGVTGVTVVVVATVVVFEFVAEEPGLFVVAVEAAGSAVVATGVVFAVVESKLTTVNEFPEESATAAGVAAVDSPPPRSPNRRAEPSAPFFVLQAIINAMVKLIKIVFFISYYLSHQLEPVYGIFARNFWT